MSGNSCCSGKLSGPRGKKISCCGGSPGKESPDVKSDACSDAGEASNISANIATSPCTARVRIEADWITGYLQTPVGEVPRISTKLRFKDTFGSWKCRWSIGRMDYKVSPGIYGVGTPDETSPVLVTANYKMTFDRVREQLSGLHLWIVVLDTNGVNVWCAAGKGTFGTEELTRRIAAVRLSEIVTHHTVILPQLGAVGVASHTVTKETGFRVTYGPVRAEDIKDFLSNGMKATEEMRTVKFTVVDRLVLTPIEVVGTMSALLITFGVFFILNAIGLGHFGFIDLYGLLGSILIGCVITPVLLPWLPGRAFSFKGGFLGLLWAVGFLMISGFPTFAVLGWMKAIAYFLILPSLSAFLAMNFTGCSTFTSLSGVDKEMKIAVPVILFSIVGGILLLLVNGFIQVLS